jgi:hypothetical protein
LSIIAEISEAVADDISDFFYSAPAQHWSAAWGFKFF